MNSMRRTIVPLGLGLLIALGLAMMLAIGWLGAPHQDLMALESYLLTSGAPSVGLGALWLIWLRRGFVRLWLQVTLTYILGISIALFNVYLTAQLMFINRQ